MKKQKTKSLLCAKILSLHKAYGFSYLCENLTFRIMIRHLSRVGLTSLWTCETNKKFQSYAKPKGQASQKVFDPKCKDFSPTQELYMFCSFIKRAQKIKLFKKTQKRFSCFLNTFTCRRQLEFMYELGLDLERDLVQTRFSLNCQCSPDPLWNDKVCPWKMFVWLSIIDNSITSKWVQIYSFLL